MRLCVEIFDSRLLPALAALLATVLAVAPAAAEPWDTRASDSPGVRLARDVVLPIVVTLVPLGIVLATIAAFFRALAGRAGLASLGPSEPAARRRARLAIYAAIFAGALAYGLWLNAPRWGMQLDEERDFLIAKLCASGRGCPLAGNVMNQLMIKLGPLNRYLMSAAQLVSPDPRVVLVALIVLHALASGLVAEIGDSLFDYPFGAVAGFLFATNDPLLDAEAAASNGAWGPFFVVVALWGILRWVRGGGTLPFVAAVAALGCAGNLHATYLLLWPAIPIAAVAFRPQTPQRAIELGVAVLFILYLPWIWHCIDTDFSDFRAISTSWILEGGSASIWTRAGRLWSFFTARDGWRPIRLLAAAAAAIAGVLVIARKREEGLDRGVRFTLLFLLAVLVGPTLLAGGGWVDRYCVVALPVVALFAAAGARAFWRAGTMPLARRAKIAAALAASALVPGSCEPIGPHGKTAGSPTLTLADQREAIDVLREHGFRAQDLERRVHGPAWTRWTGGQIYLGQWLLGTKGDEPAEHVLVEASCDFPLTGFAAWEAPLRGSTGVKRRLVGYRAELAPAELSLIGDGEREPAWSAPIVPFHGQVLHLPDNALRAAVDPALARPGALLAEMLVAWNRPGPRALRIRTELAAGARDRTITVTHDSKLVPHMRIGGVERPPTAADRREARDTISRERYLITASERAGALPIELTIDVPDARLPRSIDVYEEPGWPCP